MRLVDLAQYTLLRQGPPKAAATPDKTLDSGISERINRSLTDYFKTHLMPKWLRPAPGSDTNSDWSNENEPGHVWKQFFRSLMPVLRDKNGEPVVNTGFRG